MKKMILYLYLIIVISFFPGGGEKGILEPQTIYFETFTFRMECTQLVADECGNGGIDVTVEYVSRTHDI